MNTRPLAIDGARLWESLMTMARIGATDKGGVRRLALTALDGEGRQLFIRWAQAAGCTITIDALGNIFARRDGTDATRAPVVTGSHLDSQPSGGKFDGSYGVLAGLEVLRTLAARDIRTAAPIEVAVWTNEEGSRFTPVMMGSGVYAGLFDVDETLARTDVDGVRVGDALTAIGFAGDRTRLGRPIGAYFETHIEQGPVLEDADKTIGVVTGGLGLRWYDVRMIGQDSHAGPTPMGLRRDALLAASEVVVAVNSVALDHAPHGRGTVGYMKVAPNSRNVVPGQVDFSVDLRASDDATLDRMEALVRAQCASISAAHGVEMTMTLATQFSVVKFAPDPVAMVRAAATARGYSNMEIVSGAGHDAFYIARMAPAAMIFVPCAGGLSHNELEDADPAHLEAGANVLLDAMLAAAG